MMLRPARGQIRPTAQTSQDRPPPQRHKTFPAPINGWNASENVAMASPLTAVVMDNWFPELTGVRFMGGSVRHASVGDEVVTSLTGTVDIDGTTDVVGTSTLFESELSPGDKIRIDGQDYIVDEITSDTALTVTTATHDTLTGEGLDLITYDLKPVETLFSYHSGGVSMFFAADETAVYDITTPADPDTPPTPAISGQTSGYYSAIPFTTSGGQFLYILNGTDEAQLFNGASWTAINGSSVPAITGVNTEDLSQGWVYRNRLFFVEKETMNVWFPNVSSLGGALQSITMHGIFRRGGSVQFGATWSLDAGDGLDDKCVIVSTEGEVAVFEGSNPAGVQETDWRMVGVYDCPRPMGKNGWLRVGGDLLILTEEGAIPVSAIMQKDPAALTISAVSRPIEPEWIAQAVRRRSLPWEMVKWPERNMGIVNVPATSEADPVYCYLVNLKSGAWARRTGWDARCLHVFNGQAYFGTNDGRVMLADVGGLDDGQPYEAFLANHFDHLDAPGLQKAVGLARATFIAEREFAPVIGASTDYVVTRSTFPGSVDDFTSDVWDGGLWDEAVWDAEGAQVPVIRWNVVGRTGFAVAWQIGVTSATQLALKAELKSVDITYQLGDLVA
jgi:hypothetical protein